MSTESTSKSMVTLRLEGELGLSCAAALVGHIENICSHANMEIQVDLGGISRIDTCGTAVLLVCHRRIHEAGGKLALCSVPETVRAMFDVCTVGALLSPADKSIAECRSVP